MNQTCRGNGWRVALSVVILIGIRHTHALADNSFRGNGYQESAAHTGASDGDYYDCKRRAEEFGLVVGKNANCIYGKLSKRNSDASTDMGIIKALGEFDNKVLLRAMEEQHGRF
ncbi:hypothetical protein FPJ27_15120 [Burkholderia sp. MS455]|uniref:hypothetical protein n=1 Tax=Burkholderia sp. MS455 TaxID=2811788 RepID=UPI001957B2F5|nr:hypothetical protein [Burkholderia sp. MS455]QRR07607.1 hypothetical protein FPJ27_15120 [Burkholderia sp. MS455]